MGSAPGPGQAAFAEEKGRPRSVWQLRVSGEGDVQWTTRVLKTEDLRI